MSSKRTITVFGSGMVTPTDALYETAVAVGRVIAEAGFALCNGGYGGTMEASARGARDAGGHTIGVTCSIFGRGGPNSFIREEISTASLFERLDHLIQRGDAYVVLPGGTGTLVELALVWELAAKGLLMPRRPVFLLGEHWQPLFGSINPMQPGMPSPRIVADVAALQVALREELSD